MQNSPLPIPPVREMGLRLVSKTRSSCIAGASEANVTQLWRKGKTRNPDRHMENSTERGASCFAVRGIMQQHLLYTNAPCFHGKQERGWGGRRGGEEMDAHIYTVIEDITVAFFRSGGFDLCKLMHEA